MSRHAFHQTRITVWMKFRYLFYINLLQGRQVELHIE